MSITALAVEALPGSTCLPAVRERIDTDLSLLASASVQGAPNPLDLAAWARASEARLSAFRLSALAEAERQGAARTKGALGTAAWLKGQGQGAAAARRDVALAGSLAEPENEATRDMLAAGRIMPEQALVVTEATDALSDQVSPEERAEFVAGLLVQAQTLDPSHLFTAAKRAAARVDPTGSGDLDKAEKAARSQRAFTMYPRAGMYVLTGQVDPEGAAYLSAALDPLSAPRATSIDGADERSPAHRRCDALVELSRRQIAAADLPDIGGVPTLVVVTLTLDQLTGPVAATTTVDAGEGCAELVGGTIREPISAGRADAWPATPDSYPPSWAETATSWTGATPNAWPSLPNAVHSPCATKGAPLAAVTDPRRGARPTTPSRSAPAAAPTWTSSPWSATPTTTSPTPTSGPSPWNPPACTGPRNNQTHHHKPNRPKARR